jgi:hypothetical protein
LIRSLALAFFIVCSCAFTTAQNSDCEHLKQLKKTTYGFRPSQLNHEQQATKSTGLDGFWYSVKGLGEPGIACVRTLIASEKDDPYFLFDAASLLWTFDQSGISDAAILDGVSRTDLDDLDIPGYISVVLYLAKKDLDIGVPASNYLHHPKVTAYLPKHGAYKLDRTAGAILLYGSMKPDLQDRYLSKEVADSNQEVRDSAAIVWSMNLTESSFKGLAALGNMENFSKPVRDQIAAIRKSRSIEVKTPPKYTREQMLAKLAKFPEIDPDINQAEDKALDNSVYVTFGPSDLEALRTARRKLIRGVSNESIEGYEEMSRVTLNLINRLDLFKEYRTH